MSDRLDEKIRALVIELTNATPLPPEFAEPEPQLIEPPSKTTSGRSVIRARSPGVVFAIVAFAIVLLVGVGGWLLIADPEPAPFGSGDDTRLLVAERWQSTINNADLEGFMALYSEDAQWGEADKDGIRDFFGWRAALNAQYRLTDCEVGPDTVTCVWSATDDFFQTAGVDTLEGRMTLTIRDGLIWRLLDLPISPRSGNDWRRVFDELGEWVQANRAESYIAHLERTPETAGLHLQLVREWVQAQ